MTFRENALEAVRSPRFWGTVALGQFMSLCITSTSTTTKIMAQNGLDIPTFQSTFVYLILAVIFNIYAFRKYGFGGYSNALKSRWLYYLALAIFDVEANYFIVKGYATTYFLSALLINACSTPFIVLLTYIFLKTRYRWTHLLGISITIVGLGLLVLSDYFVIPLDQVANPLLGNAFCFIAAFFYAISNTLEEYCVRRQPKWEILAFLGLFGFIVSISQVLILERQELFKMVWTAESVYPFVGFVVALLSFYLLAPVIIDLTSATFFNISLLSSEFYGLLIGLTFFDATAHALYPFAFLLIIFGLLFYNFQPLPTLGVSEEIVEEPEAGSSKPLSPSPKHYGSP